MEKIKIIEIFSSIEGEGSLIGYPTTFIRLEGCNLRCTWCDTKYSYDTNNYKELSIKDVLHTVKHLKNNKVCITGGEPLYNPQFNFLATALLNEGYSVIIETNGTILDNKTQEIFQQFQNNIHIVCSPKPFSNYKIDGNLKKYINEIKLVVDEFLTEKIIYLFKDFPIVLQPEGNKKEFFEKAVKLQRNILEKWGIQVRVIPQIHKIFNMP